VTAACSDTKAQTPNQKLENRKLGSQKLETAKTRCLRNKGQIRKEKREEKSKIGGEKQDKKEIAL